MSHPKITQTITFTDEFKDDLNLSASQIEAIDNLDYLRLREYTFSRAPEYSEKKERQKYFRSLLTVLNEDQIANFRTLRRKKKEEQRNINAEIRDNQLKRTFKKYESLGLSDQDSQSFMNILEEIRELLHKEATDNIYQNKPNRNRQQRYLEIANKKLGGFFDKGQLKRFHQIEQKEHRDIVHSRMDFIRHQYSPLNLSAKQAKCIYDHEENEPIYDKNSEYLSEFEKWDKEKDFMKSILDKIQFTFYLKLKEKSNALYIDGLKESNKRKFNEVKRLENRKRYLTQNYMPIKCKWRNNLEKLINNDLSADIDQIRVDYFENLISDLERNLKQSARYNQSYVPNELVHMHLEMQINCLLPKVTVMKEKHRRLISRLPKELFESLLNPDVKVKKADAKLHEFMIMNYEDSGGTYGGWIHVIRDWKKDDGSTSILSNLLLQTNVEKNVTLMNKAIEKIGKLSLNGKNL